MGLDSAPPASAPLDFSAIVVTFNERARLRACLESLRFCKQVVVIDLGSSDDCVAIARECGAEVLHHPRVPWAERVWPVGVDACRHEWLVRADPDEVMPPGMAADLTEVIRNHPMAGLVTVPYQNYFLGRPLTTTQWGRQVQIHKAWHRRRVDLSPDVHRPFRLRDNFARVAVPRRSDNAVQHYWVDSLASLFEKHRRYVQGEGASRHHHGERFSWGGAMYRIVRTGKRNLIDDRGWRGGVAGWFLSFFAMGYEACSQWSLRSHSRRT